MHARWWVVCGLVGACLSVEVGAGPCTGTVYLTIDTGNMAPAEEMAATLRHHDVKATFFLANERTTRGDTALSAEWAPFWRQRVAEGHAFGSHTWRHWSFRGDVAERVRYVAPGGKSEEVLDAAGVCLELRRSEDAFRAMTGRAFDPIWRAPGGKLTANVDRAARTCGFKHVGWTPAGFSGDELASERFPSDALIAQQLRSIRDGDILVWHLGIWSRKDPLYPRLGELIGGLKARGLCFARITEHPEWKLR